jgi:PAS domain S-box-containing protein
MEKKGPRTPPPDRQLFFAALDLVRDGVVACDAEGAVLVFNRAALELHARAEGPASAGEWAERFDLYLPDGETPLVKDESPLLRALRGESVRDAEVVVAPPGGRRRRLLVSGQAARGPGGELLGAVVLMRDAAGRQQGQEVFQSEGDLLRALMEHFPDAIYFKDTEGHFILVNRHVPYRGGGDPGRVVGKTDFDFFVEEHARAAREDEQRVIRTGVPIVDKVEHETYPDGSATWLSTTKAPVYDAEGRVTGIVGISRDITERRLAEEARLELAREQAARAEAEAANRRKDEFLAMVSHELRTPLTPILGWVRILRLGHYDAEALSRGLEAIERSALSQLRIVEDILDVSRIVTGNLRLEAAPLDIGPLVERAAEAMRAAAEAKGVELLCGRPAAPCPVACDPGRLQQVVWNLVGNAVKFTPAGGTVTVSLLRRESSAEVVVSDTGRGISREFLPFVFDSFRQADSSTTRAHGGLGLGLSIVRRLVELHGGEVTAESEGEGMGSRFTVRLPLAADGSGAAGPPDASPPRVGAVNLAGETPLRGLRVLAVDDEAGALELLAAALGGSGAEVIPAASAAEALRAFEAARPDILVSDLGMPGEDGYTLIRRVRELPPERGGLTPAIALTAYAGEGDRARAIEAGYQAHVPKPFDPAELTMVLAELAGRAREP